ncbi:MAG TPA: hypothetical protein VFZ61_17380 [Polyangiales bacterium]
MADELNPKARALVEAGRAALRATDADRARVEQALQARLGPEVMPPDPGPAHATGMQAWRTLAGLTAGAGLLVGAALLVLQPAAKAPPARTQPSAPAAPAQSAAPAAGSPATDSPGIAAPARAPVEPPSIPRDERARAKPAPVPDRLAQEVALLSRATSDLRAGHAARALKALDEHQRRFPAGALREDRRAARGQALCLLGRAAEARSELALLPQGSPAAARVSQVCDAGSLEAPPPNQP